MKNERVCAYIDMNALVANVDAMKKNIDKDTRIIAVIKTNGYGHGASEIASVLEGKDCIFGYAVATAEEALSLRKDGMKKPILILGYVFEEWYESLIENEVRFSVFRHDQIKALEKAAKSCGKKAIAHIKVDTAMSRIGIYPDNDGMEFVRNVMACEMIDTEGVFTHFARADETDKSHALKQLEDFNDFTGRIKNEFPDRIKYFH
ncbi:MAG: alanine racemase, partial [Lachnospiraceae bacterium]|nr:alanine racemase [Lachnospiraceae bacterium]